MFSKKNIQILFILILILNLGMVFADSCDDPDSTTCTIDDNNIFFPTNNITETIDTSKTEIFAAVYFTGIGCPHCAKVDPVLLKEMVFEENLAIIEYEVKSNKENASLLLEYNKEFSSGKGYPLLIIDKDNQYLSNNIIPNLEKKIQENKTNKLLFPKTIYEKERVSFEDLEFSKLKGKPAIWYNGIVLTRYYDGLTPIDNKILHKILNAKTTEEINQIIKQEDYHTITEEKEKKIILSQTEIIFDNTTHLPGWKVYWNGESTLEYKECPITEEITDPNCGENKKIPLYTIVSLALVDAVNPCEFAVLIMLLIAIMTADPKNKKKTLQAGLMFALAIFLLYFLYGILLINVFKLIPAIDLVRKIIYTAVAAVALIVGALQIKDFFFYKPGGFLTEMPMAFRPTVKKLISSITSPKGAFVVGAIVTVFLMPCTMGPYVILGNLLSTQSLVSVLPELLLYNVIFIMPMIIITLLVYLGVKKVDEVAEWKERNIRYMHLIAGIIMVLIGLGMLLGWF